MFEITDERLLDEIADFQDLLTTSSIDALERISRDILRRNPAQAGNLEPGFALRIETEAMRREAFARSAALEANLREELADEYADLEDERAAFERGKSDYTAEELDAWQTSLACLSELLDSAADGALLSVAGGSLASARHAGPPAAAQWRAAPTPERLLA